MKRSHGTLSRPRRGVSLMEVLFAIGIVITGLLGVIALLPVAAHYAAKGLRMDHASAVGANAVAEFKIRGMGQPQNWLMWETRPDPQGMDPDTPLSLRSIPNLRTGSPPVVAAGSSYCLDPRFVAAHSATPWTINSRVFPYGVDETGDRPSMWRITLRSQPGGGRMSRRQADEVFLSHDDLAFVLPDDATLPPTQEYGVGDKRQYEGRMSWFATLVPRMSQARQRSFNGQTTRIYDPNVDRDTYTLSIVVLQQRDVAFELNEINERHTDVVQFYGGFDGGGGGDLQIGGLTEASVDLQEGDWILLCRRVNTLASGPPAPYFRWYRVATTDSEATQVNTDWWTRDVSLLGGDWDTRTGNYPPALAFPGLDGSSQVATQAVLVKGVVAVYERTIRLESSSLWVN